MTQLGSDFSGDSDLDPALSMSSGRRALGQAIVRRLSTPAGRLADFPAYGFDVTSLIGRIVSVTAIVQGVSDQCRQEEEVEDVDVTATYSQNASALRLDIKVQSGLGPFDLTLNVNDLGVTAIIPQGD